VRADVISGAVSAEASAAIYGVQLRDGEVDSAATTALRATIRGRRIPDYRGETHALAAVARLGPNLKVVRDAAGLHVDTIAGVRLVSGSTRWRSGAIPRAVEPPDALHRITLHRDLAMTAYYCPGSGLLLAVDVHEAGHLPADDIMLDITKL
jgi:N-methylhydantoinase B